MHGSHSDRRASSHVSANISRTRALRGRATTDQGSGCRPTSATGAGTTNAPPPSSPQPHRRDRRRQSHHDRCADPLPSASAPSASPEVRARCRFRPHRRHLCRVKPCHSSHGEPHESPTQSPAERRAHRRPDPEVPWRRRHRHPAHRLPRRGFHRHWQQICVHRLRSDRMRAARSHRRSRGRSIRRFDSARTRACPAGHPRRWEARRGCQAGPHRAAGRERPQRPTRLGPGRLRHLPGRGRRQQQHRLYRPDRRTEAAAVRSHRLLDHCPRQRRLHRDRQRREQRRPRQP